MYFEHFGNEKDSAIVFLHGANYIHAFGKQYCLADRYYLVVPHIMGYGNQANKTFETDLAIAELMDLIRSLNRKVKLIGFSLGAQIATRMLAEDDALFTMAILVSPWLIKDESMLTKVMQGNERQLQQLKSKSLCTLTGFFNGLNKAQRREFVQQMQNVSLQTVRNSVYNGITLDTIVGFENVSVPMIALAGEKELPVVKDSITELAAMNPNCSAALWKGAAHNIPQCFPKRFIKLICESMEKNNALG